ncbi:ABC transporter permease subunit [Paenibacillus sacheonensis]|uniref:ABC transporter permease subunit n=2 Tax=Paenibacillus sacheonensis TaxID=742054 RepID=A0A7X4YM21_9BACL|nr:ABC transporter permease subunit [Paenibacillus sacheonensis]
MKHGMASRSAVLIFTLPAILLFTVFVMYPLAQTFYRSFFDWDGLTPGTFIFLDNFKEILHDPIFYTSLYNGLFFAVILTIFQFVLGSFLAFALYDHKIFGKKLLRISYFIPVILSVTVVCQLWMSIYSSQYGLLNKIFESIGISYRQDWLSDSHLAIFAVISVAGWQSMGFMFALIYTAIKSVPEHYFEAAKLEGATKFQIHTKITIPLLAETYRMCLMFSVVGGLNAYGQVVLMTNGGPGTSTATLTFAMFRSAYSLDRFGYGCATAVMLVLECLICILIINKLVARERITF